MRTLSLAAVALALGLAACSDEPENVAEGGLTLEEAQSELAGMEQPMAGRYEQTAEVRSLEIPGVPDEMLGQMEQVFQQQGQRGFCLTQEQADKGFEEMYKQLTQDQNCKYETFDVDNGRINAELVCRDNNATPIRMKLDGSANATGSDMVMTITGPAPQGEMNVEMAMTSKRVGECEG